MNQPVILFVLVAVLIVQGGFGFSVGTVSRNLVTRVNKLFKKQEPKSPEDLHSLILTRRTINDFEPTLPDGWENAIHRAVEAAIYAPNHKRTEPWRFHLLGPEAIQRVCKLNADLVTKKKGKEAGLKKLDRWLKMPGWLVVTQVLAGEEGGSFTVPDSVTREDYAACCCAVQNLCLSLHKDGYGTKWTTGPVNFDSKFGEAVGNLASNESVVGTIWFGVPSKIPPTPPKRLSVDDVLCKHD